MVRDELKQGGASLSLSLRCVWQSRDIPSDESPSLSLSLIPVYPLTAYSGSAAFLVAPLSFCLRWLFLKVSSSLKSLGRE